jgi:hypothetical protein
MLHADSIIRWGAMHGFKTCSDEGTVLHMLFTVCCCAVENADQSIITCLV